MKSVILFFMYCALFGHIDLALGAGISATEFLPPAHPDSGAFPELRSITFRTIAESNIPRTINPAALPGLLHALPPPNSSLLSFNTLDPPALIIRASKSDFIDAFQSRVLYGTKDDFSPLTQLFTAQLFTEKLPINRVGRSEIYRVEEYDIKKVPILNITNAQDFSHEVRQLVLLQKVPGVVPIISAVMLKANNKVNGFLITQAYPFLLPEYLATQFPENLGKFAATFYQKLHSILHEIHQNGFVHRDVNPGQIFVTKDEQFILSNFSLSKPKDSITEEGTEGNAKYLPPYGPDCDVAKPEIDFFALAKIVAAMIDGEGKILGHQDDLKTVISVVESSNNPAWDFDPELRTNILKDLSVYLTE